MHSVKPPLNKQSNKTKVSDQVLICVHAQFIPVQRNGSIKE